MDDFGSTAEVSQQTDLLEEGTKPLVDGQESHSARYKHYESMDIESQFGKVKSHLSHLRQLRLFIYLSILAATMIIINIIQAALIDRIHSIFWVTVFPGAVLVASLVAIGLNAGLSRKTIMLEWTKAEVPRRLAWIGIVASMFLPIILCQFLYMPIVAVTAWHTAMWTTAIEADNTTLYPSVVISNMGYNPADGVAVTFSRPACSVRNATSSQPVNCITSDVQTGFSLWNGYQFFTFNSMAQPNATGTADIASPVAGLALSIGLSYNSSAWAYDSLPFLQVGLYDPEILFNLDEFVWNCGNPPFYYTVNTEITTTTILDLAVQRTLFSDNAEVLPDQLSNPGGLDLCSTNNITRRRYTYYDAQSNLELQGPSSLTNSSCDIASANYINGSFCSFSVNLKISSELLTTQTSSHGTTTLQILIDEGGILGGILFFTWFFSIFVV